MGTATKNCPKSKKRKKISPKRLAANRRNATKSTGPRIDEGKARARQNSTTHGMAGAGLVVHPEDQDPLQQRLQDWTGDLRPEGSVQHWLVGRAALASVRLDRAARVENACLEGQRASVQGRWEAEQAERLDGMVFQFQRSPVLGLERLQGTSAGCGWVADRWDGLLKALVAQGGWSSDQLDGALYLLGEANPDRPASPLGAEVVRLAGAAGGKEGPAALSALRSFIEAEVARLVQRRDALWHEVEGPARARLDELALVDLSPEATLRRRYESANSLEVQRCLNQLRFLQREQAEACESAAPSAPAKPSAAVQRRAAKRVVSLLRGKKRRRRVSLTAPEPAVAPSAVSPEPFASPQPLAKRLPGRSRNEAKRDRTRAAARHSEEISPAKAAVREAQAAEPAHPDGAACEEEVVCVGV